MIPWYIKKAFKDILIRSPIRSYLLYHSNLDNVSAPQLCFLCDCLEKTRDIEGSIVEIGCSNGMTTVFLGKYLQYRNIDKPHYAIDTFNGFIQRDIEYEKVQRKKSNNYNNSFKVNSKRWFDETMHINGLKIESFKSDIAEFPIEQLGRISFCFLDIDLYLPTKVTIPKVYKSLSSGGIFIVHDCFENTPWDGAYQAYIEFTQEKGISPNIIHDNLGVIIKSNHSFYTPVLPSQ